MGVVCKVTHHWSREKTLTQQTKKRKERHRYTCRETHEMQNKKKPKTIKSKGQKSYK